jgi:hypothetical protein
MEQSTPQHILVPPRELQTLCARAANAESEDISILTVGFIKLGPPSWLKNLQETYMWQRDGEDFITPEGATEALRALPLKIDLRASHSLDIDYFWSWDRYGVWTLPWRKPHGPDPGVFDATGPLRLVWILIFGRLQSSDQDTITWASYLHNTLVLTPQHVNDLLELGSPLWQRDVVENMWWMSNRLLMTREGLDLILRIAPSVIRSMLRLGDPSLEGFWRCQCGGLRQKSNWILARMDYKTDPVCFCFQTARYISPHLRLRVTLSMRRRLGCQRQMAPRQAKLVQAAILPWIRTPASMAKWASGVMVGDTKGDMRLPMGFQIDSVTGMSYGFDMEFEEDLPESPDSATHEHQPEEDLESPREEAQTAQRLAKQPLAKESTKVAVGQGSQSASPTLADVGKMTMAPTSSTPLPHQHTHPTLLDMEIEELNRQARQERQQRREAQATSRPPMEAPREQGHNNDVHVAHAVKTADFSKKQRARRHRQEQRHILDSQKALAKQTEQDQAFLRMCRPALEAAKKGPEDQTQVQEDMLPEIERQTRRALGAQQRRQRRDDKLAKKAASQLESVEMKRLVLGTMTPRGWDV